jgi:hypothetical protein
MTAYLGRDPREAGNSNRSMTGMSNVSDSFLSPVIKRGTLRTVRDVEIRGDVYVRIAGREDVARVTLEVLRRERDTIKLPVESAQQFKEAPNSRLFLERGNSSSTKAAYG